MLAIEPRASHMQHKHSTNWVTTQHHFLFLFFLFDYKKGDTLY
jgi:hypothetical protein